MRTVILAAAALLLASPAVAGGGLGAGEKAPWPEAKETINFGSFSTKSVEGRVVLVDIFRTW